MKKALLIVALVIVAFVAYSMWSTDREAHEILDGFTRAGVVREYVCDRTAPSIKRSARSGRNLNRERSAVCSRQCRWFVRRPRT
jgi:hypothetical protein